MNLLPIGNKPTSGVEIVKTKTLNNPSGYDLNAANFGYAVHGNNSFTLISAHGDSSVYLLNATSGDLIHHFKLPQKNVVAVSVCDLYSLIYDNTSNIAYIYSNSTGLLHKSFTVSVASYLIAISDSYVAFTDPNFQTYAGRVLIFDALSGLQLTTINSVSGDSYSFFGESLSFVSSSNLIIGEPLDRYNYDTALPHTLGKAYNIDISNNNSASQIPYPNTYNIRTADIRFSYSTASSSTNFAISAPYEEDTGGYYGTVYLYGINDTTPTHYFSSPPAYLSYIFGYGGNGVVLSSSHIAILSYLSSSTEKVVHVFKLSDYSLVGTITSPNSNTTNNNDYFGSHISISDNLICISAYAEDTHSNWLDDGVVYYFSTVDCSLVKTVINPHLSYDNTNDYFGISTVTNGTICAVSSPRDASPLYYNSGSVHLFDVVSGDFISTIFNPELSLWGDQFGSVVAITNSYIIISDMGYNSFSGRVYVYNTSGSLLSVISNPNIYNTIADDQFGSSLDVTDTIIAVGALGEDNSDSSNIYEGAVYLFNVSNGTPYVPHPVIFSEDIDPYRFGESVAISGNYLAVGESDRNRVSVYDITTGLRITSIANPNINTISSSDYFGQTISLSGTNLLVGAWLESVNGITNSGVGYLFNCTTGALLSTFTKSGSIYMGYTCSMSDTYVILSNPESEAYIFNIDGSFLTTLSIPTNTGNPFGLDVSGDTIVLGSPYSDVIDADDGEAFIYKILG